MNKKILNILSLTLMILANLALGVFYVLVGVLFIGAILSAFGANNSATLIFLMFALWSIVNVVLCIVGLVIGHKRNDLNKKYLVICILIMLFNTGLAAVSAYVFINMPNVILTIVDIVVFVGADIMLVVDLLLRKKNVEENIVKVKPIDD